MKRQIVATLASILVAGGTAWAQSTQHDAIAPTVTGETGGFNLFSGDTLRQGDWSFGLYANNWDRTLRLADDRRTEVSLDLTRLSASVGYGITDRWEISFMVPYEDYNFDVDDFDEEFNFEGDPDAADLGRLRLGSKWTITGSRESGSAMAFTAFIEAPTGDKDIPMGEETGFGIGLAGNNSNWLWNIGYYDSGADEEFNDFGELATGGVGYLGSISDQFFWITELQAAVQVGDSEIDDAFDLTTGGRYWFGPDSDWAFNFAMRLDMAQVSDIDEHCPIGGLIGLTYRPRFHAPPPPPEPEPMPAPAPPPPPPPAPTPTPPPPAPAPKPEIREECTFTSGSRLSNVCKAKFDEVALQMKQDPSATAEITGYSDNTGSDASNMAISEQRAKNTMDYLVTRHGIDPSRITARGVGSADPAASNDSPEGRAMNRRVVIVVRGQ